MNKKQRRLLKRKIDKIRNKLGEHFAGLQIDLWSAPGDSESYACMTITMVDPDTYEMVSEVIGFECFDVDSHTGDNIRKWVYSILRQFGMTLKDIILMTMDGATNNVKAFKDEAGLDTQICVDYGLQCDAQGPQIYEAGTQPQAGAAQCRREEGQREDDKKVV